MHSAMSLETQVHLSMANGSSPGRSVYHPSENILRKYLLTLMEASIIAFVKLPVC